MAVPDALVIHVWPGRWNLSSFDPSCLAAVLYLQFSFPGHFSISEESNPDRSPSGKYLVVGLK
jgi:sorting and assembly machinery component 37